MRSSFVLACASAVLALAVTGVSSVAGAAAAVSAPGAAFDIRLPTSSYVHPTGEQLVLTWETSAPLEASVNVTLVNAHTLEFVASLMDDVKSIPAHQQQLVAWLPELLNVEYAILMQTTNLAVPLYGLSAPLRMTADPFVPLTPVAGAVFAPSAQIYTSWHGSSWLIEDPQGHVEVRLLSPNAADEQFLRVAAPYQQFAIFSLTSQECVQNLQFSFKGVSPALKNTSVVLGPIFSVGNCPGPQPPMAAATTQLQQPITRRNRAHHNKKH